MFTGQHAMSKIAQAAARIIEAARYRMTVIEAIFMLVAPAADEESFLPPFPAHY